MVLTSMSSEATFNRALDAGVAGFIPKHLALDALLVSIRQAAAGEMVAPNSLLKGLLGRSGSGWPVVIKLNTAPLLSPLEREILAMLVEGLSGPEMAEALLIALPALRSDIGSLLNKLGVHSRLQAAAYAIKHGLVIADPHSGLRQLT
jgi:two-component system nitrate/nitrite response regulator NarL